MHLSQSQVIFLASSGMTHATAYLGVVWSARSRVSSLYYYYYNAVARNKAGFGLFNCVTQLLGGHNFLKIPQVPRFLQRFVTLPRA